MSAAAVTPAEAAARDARYAALRSAAERHGAAIVLTGHTRNDQAETILLGLARGSGPGSLRGMAELDGLIGRPLLDVTRESTHAAALAEGLDPWDDPHNSDERYSRVRVRHAVLPVMETELGPGIIDALARTADLVRDDDDALDLLRREGSKAAPGFMQPEGIIIYQSAARMYFKKTLDKDDEWKGKAAA
jgi:tRNA(Ile)-lysidine synthase